MCKDEFVSSRTDKCIACLGLVLLPTRMSCLDYVRGALAMEWPARGSALERGTEWWPALEFNIWDGARRVFGGLA